MPQLAHRSILDYQMIHHAQMGTVLFNRKAWQEYVEKTFSDFDSEDDFALAEIIDIEIFYIDSMGHIRYGANGTKLVQVRWVGCNKDSFVSLDFFETVKERE